MAWYLNRPGSQAHEGPFEDHQIVEMIRSGQLREGYITEPGNPNWRALNQHPPFAQALAGGAPPGQPGPAGHAYAPQPHAAAQPAPGYPQPGHPGQPGAPGGPPGYGHAPAVSPGAAKEKKKGGNLGLIIGVVVGVVLLIGGGAAAMMLLSGGGKSQLSAVVPDSTVVFVEVPNTAHALKGILGVDYLNPSELNSETHLNNLVRDFGAAFDLDKSDAEKLVFSVESVGFAMGQIPSRGERVAVLIGFRSADAVEKLLSTSRFTKDGKFGSSGERYFVEPGKVEDAKEPLLQGLNGFRVRKESKSKAMVWFPDQAVMGFGVTEFLDDIDSVITKGDKTLASSEIFKRANFDAKSSAISFISPEMLEMMRGDDERKFLKDYMDEIKPFAVEMSFVDAGILLRGRGQLKGKRITEEEKLPPEVDLNLHQKLPLGTFAYIAAGSEKKEDGKEFRNRLIKQVRASDARAADEMERGLDEIEKQVGIRFEEVVDSVGNQVALGLVAETDTKLDPKLPPDTYIAKSAALFLVQVGNQDAADKVIKQARRKLFDEGPMKEAYEVKDQGKGFRAVPKEPKLPVVSVFFHENVMSIGVGGRGILAKSILALGGKEAITSDAAHQTAMSTFKGKPRFLMWVDTGRMGQLVLDALPERAREELAEVEKTLNVSVKAIQTSGDKRITSAMAGYVTSEATTWDYQLEVLNPSAMGIFGALEPLMKGAFAPPPALDTPPDIGDVGDFFISKSGVAQCDGLAMVVFQCGKRTNNASFQARGRLIESRTKAQLASGKSKNTVGGACIQELLKFNRENQQCSKF